MKKILALCLVVVLAATAVTGATLAYFTDTDDATNTFTIGNVDIEIRESQLHRHNDKATDEQILEDSEEYQDYLAEAGQDLVPGEWVKKAPYIENVGSNPAYVRVKLTLPTALDKLLYIMEYTTAQEEGAISAVSTEDVGDNTVYTWTFLKPLAPGELSYYAPFWQFCLANDLDNEDLVNFSGDIENDLIVTAEAIQAEGFDTAAEAFEAYDAQS